MENRIACCGLDCATCDARIATESNNEELKKVIAKKWQQMYNAPDITPESISCTGCRADGVKFAHCNECEIRRCAKFKEYETCADCPDMDVCDIVAAVHQHVPEAIDNLKNLK